MNSLTGSRGPTGRNSGMGGSANKMNDIIPKGYGVSQLQRMTPGQMGIMDQLTGMIGPESYLSRLAGGDEEMFRQIEQPALRQFGEIQGGIASRFSGQGMGSRRSSGFQNTMGQLGSDFASQLQSQRQDLQRQALLDMSDIGNMLMGQNPYERELYQKQQKQKFNWGGLAGGVGGFLVGGPGGAMTGYNLGTAANSFF